MPLYNLQSEDDQSSASDLAGLLSAVIGSQRRKSLQSDIYRRAAAGELQPSYEVDAMGNPKGISYKSVNPKDAAEAAMMQMRLEQMIEQKQNRVGDPYSQAVDMYPTEYDEYGLPKKYGSKTGDIEQQYNDLIKQLSKPVAGEVATKYSGAIQGVRNVDDIIKMLELKESEGGVTASPKFKEMILSQKRAGTKPRSYNVPVVGDIANMISQIYSGIVQGTSTEEGRDLDLLYSTLAENLLRARTGAQAPEPEIIREEMRTLARYFDSPKNTLNRLKTSRQFLHDVAGSIRPNYEQYIDPNTGDVLPDKLQKFAREFVSGRRQKRGGVTSSGVGFTIEE